jgi:hypothetical protein
MSEDRRLPVPVVIEQQIALASLQLELAQVRETAATTQLLLAERDHMLARYCETIDAQREKLRIANETIALVTMQRDSWMNEAKRLRPDLYPVDTGFLATVRVGRPTVAELDALLNSEDDRAIEILPDGSIRAIDPGAELLPYRPPSPEFAKLVADKARFEKLVAETVQVADTRECTCHPSEALDPCPRQYAYTECLAAAAADAAMLGTGVLHVVNGEARRVTLDEFQKPSDAPAFPANALRGGDGVFRG